MSLTGVKSSITWILVLFVMESLAETLEISQHNEKQIQPDKTYELTDLLVFSEYCKWLCFIGLNILDSLW